MNKIYFGLLFLMLNNFFVIGQNKGAVSVEKTFYKNGLPSKEVWYSADKKIDSIKTYLIAGGLMELFYFDENGKLHGKCSQYSAENKLKTSWEFNHGKLLNRTDNFIDYNLKNKNIIERSLATAVKYGQIDGDNPDNRNALYARASALSALGNGILALNDFLLLKDIYEERKQLKDSAVLAEVYSRVGSAYSYYNESDKSIHYRMLAIKTNPKETRHWYNLGSYLSLGQRNFREGMHYLKEVLKIHPKHNFANWALGACYLELEQYDLAFKYVNLAFDNEAFLYKYGTGKSENDIRTVRGLAYHKLGKSELGIADLNEAIHINDKNSIAHAYLGIVYSDLGQKQKACEYFQKAKELAYDKKYPYREFQSFIEKACNSKEKLDDVPFIAVKDMSYIAPNPAVDFVEVFNFPYLDFSYQIFNINSQLIREGKSTNSKVKVDGLPTGLYLLTINKEGKQETFRLLKN